MITSGTPTLRSDPMTPTYAPASVSATPTMSPCGDRPERAVEPAERGRRERVDEDAAHHVRLQEQQRRDEHPRHRAHGGGQAPAERQRPADADADQPRRGRVGGHGAHPEPDLGVLEEQVEQPHDRRDHAEHAERGEAHADPGRLQRAAGEGVGEVLDEERPDPPGRRVDEDEQADGDDHDGELGSALDRPDDHPFDEHAHAANDTASVSTRASQNGSPAATHCQAM